MQNLFEATRQIQLSTQAGGELDLIDPNIQGDNAAVVAAVTKGMGAMVAWPALLRKLDRVDLKY